MSSLSRRRFLKGAGGAVLALPWLESLSLGQAVASSASKSCWVMFYVPIGVVRRAFFPGEAEAAIPKFSSDQKEIPTDVQIALGRHGIEWTPTLSPLRDIGNRVSFLTGLDRTYQHGTDVHAQCGSCFLSAVAPNTATESAYPQGRTLDHILAERLDVRTPFRTLEFSCNSHKDNKESIYFDNVSWYGEGQVAPSMRDPRKVYRRLFRTEDARASRNITDLVLEDARSLRRELGRQDQEKLGEYFESIRAIERRIERLEGMRDSLATVDLAEPPEAHLPRGEYIRLMGDLMVAALKSGLTRVATFMVGPERWDTPYRYEGLFDSPRSHHQMSHNQHKFIDDLERVDLFHMECFRYLVDRLAEATEDDGRSLLDHTVLTYGSGLGDGATHQYSDLPIITAGGEALGFQHGARQHFADGTPLANLWLTQARSMGVAMDRFADSVRSLDSLRTI